MVVVTRHATQRIKERLGLNKRSVEKLTNRALAEGINACDLMNSSLKFFLFSQLNYLLDKGKCKIIVYNYNVFIFEVYDAKDDILITVLNLPKEYHREVDKLKRKL